MSHSREAVIPIHQQSSLTNAALFNLSQHARERIARRNLSAEDLEYVLQHGHRLRVAGVRIYHLRRRDIPYTDQRISRVSQLEGTTILVSRDNTVITAYRNRECLHRELQKTKWRR